MIKKLNLIKNIFLSNIKKLNSPYKLTFALTYRCNLKCKICKIWETPFKEELAIVQIEKIFKNLKELSWLDLTGGEITLREDLIEITKTIIKNAKKLLVLHITSNGQLTDKLLLLIKEIKKYNIIPVINISVDGSEKINDRLRGLEGAYQNSIETFRSLKSQFKGYFYLSCTLSNYNIDYIDGFMAGLNRDIPNFNPSDLHFNVFHSSSNYYNNQHVDGLSRIKFDNIKGHLKLCERGNLIKIFLEDRYVKGLFRYMDGNKFPLECKALNSTCFINPYGKVYPCGAYNRVIADLKDYDYNLNKLWVNSNISKDRKDIENGVCSGCWTPCEAYPAILGNILRSTVF